MQIGLHTQSLQAPPSTSRWQVLPVRSVPAVHRLSATATEAAPSTSESRCPFSGTSLFTRITDTPAQCPFAGAENLSVKETDYQPWKVCVCPQHAIGAHRVYLIPTDIDGGAGACQGAPFKLTTGLEPLADTEDLFEIDEHFVEEMEERRQLFKQMRTDVFASTPEVCGRGHCLRQCHREHSGTHLWILLQAQHANQELLEMIADMLPRRYPDR